jgi:hypothetical protein
MPMTGYIICQVRCENQTKYRRCWHWEMWNQAVEFLVTLIKDEYGVECDLEEIETDYGVEVQTPLDGDHRYVFALLEPE